jgi:hypothetical protein
MPNDDDARRARALARASWPVKAIALRDEGIEGPVSLDPRSVSARVASVWSLTLDAWASSGRPLPTYSRSETPGRLVDTRSRGARRDAARDPP